MTITLAHVRILLRLGSVCGHWETQFCKEEEVLRKSEATLCSLPFSLVPASPTFTCSQLCLPESFCKLSCWLDAFVSPLERLFIEFLTLLKSLSGDKRVITGIIIISHYRGWCLASTKYREMCTGVYSCQIL